MGLLVRLDEPGDLRVPEDRGAIHLLEREKTGRLKITMHRTDQDRGMVASETGPENAEVAAVFAAFPGKPRARLLELRQLVFEVAESLPGVGPIQETLKWGEPAYLTPATKAGATLRLGWKPDAPESYSMFVHCRTSLVDSFRALDPGLSCIGDREVRFPVSEPLPPGVRDCIVLTLTYHKPGLRPDPA